MISEFSDRTLVVFSSFLAIWYGKFFLAHLVYFLLQNWNMSFFPRNLFFLVGNAISKPCLLLGILIATGLVIFSRSSLDRAGKYVWSYTFMMKRCDILINNVCVFV